MDTTESKPVDMSQVKEIPDTKKPAQQVGYGDKVETEKELTIEDVIIKNNGYVDKDGVTHSVGISGDKLIDLNTNQEVDYSQVPKELFDQVTAVAPQPQESVASNYTFKEERSSNEHAYFINGTVNKRKLKDGDIVDYNGKKYLVEIPSSGFSKGVVYYHEEI